MQEYKLKGLWVPFEVLSDNNLSDKEKFIYALILFHSNENKSCNISNGYISKLFSISKTQASKLVNSLKEKGFLEIKIIRNDNKQIEDRILTPIKLFNNTSQSKVNEPIEENAKPPIEEKFKDNKIIYNNKYIIINI